MTKTWETKKKILDLIKKGNITMSEMSEVLDLTPSTVSQHLKELSNEGTIRLKERSISRKWKYYEPAVK